MSERRPSLGNGLSELGHGFSDLGGVVVLQPAAILQSASHLTKRHNSNTTHRLGLVDLGDPDRERDENEHQTVNPG